MADHALNETFEISGDWFLPESPARKIAGTLNYSPQWTELHLNETFQPLRGTIHVNANDQMYPVIHGITREGEAMTLLNSQRMGQSLNFGSGGVREPERLVTSWLLIGSHLSQDYAYPEMNFRVPGLQIWLSRPIIKQSHERDIATDSSSLSYSVQWPTKETCRVPSLNANLSWGYGWKSNCDAYTSIDLTVAGWVTLQPDEPQQLEWYLHQFGKLTTLMTFLAGSPMSPDCINASMGDPSNKANVMVTLRDAKYCTYKNISDFFMPRGAMGIDLAEVVNRWLEIYPKVHMPSQLALSVLASEKLWLHVEFLSLMQALEGFHRGLYDGLYMDDTGYELVKKALGDAIPTGLASDHKDALKSRIRYGNQVSLRKRMDSLAKLISDPIRKMILGGNGSVPRKWIDTRNYYTHWDEELRANVLDGQGMYNANIRMRHFLRALYLNLMGIPQESILSSLQNSSDSSQHLVQINSREKA